MAGASFTLSFFTSKLFEFLFWRKIFSDYKEIIPLTPFKGGNMAPIFLTCPVCFGRFGCRARGMTLFLCAKRSIKPEKQQESKFKQLLPLRMDGKIYLSPKIPEPKLSGQSDRIFQALTYFQT